RPHRSPLGPAARVPHAPLRSGGHTGITGKNGGLPLRELKRNLPPSGCHATRTATAGRALFAPFSRGRAPDPTFASIVAPLPSPAAIFCHTPAFFRASPAKPLRQGTEQVALPHDWHSAVATFGSITDEEETVAHLSDHDWDLLLQIPKRRTKTILQGPQLQEACRNFALTGGTQGGGDWVYHL